MYEDTLSKFMPVISQYDHIPSFQLSLINIKMGALTELWEAQHNEEYKELYLIDLEKLNKLYVKIYSGTH